MSASSRWKIASTLPITMRKLLLMRGTARYFFSHPPGKTAIRSALSSIVAKSASSQSVKGLLTAGLFKCAHYIVAKVYKRFDFKTFSTAPLRV